METIGFVSDEDVLNNISDDVIYLSDFVDKEKKSHTNNVRQTHVGRIVVVFTYTALEAFRDLAARAIGFELQTS